jgi:hypothetical protein
VTTSPDLTEAERSGRDEPSPRFNQDLNVVALVAS